MRIAVLGAGLALALPALAAATDLQTVGKGHALYIANCMPCHGPDARGTGHLAATFKKPLPDLTRIAERDGRFEPVHVIVHIAGERAGDADREMIRFQRAFLDHGSNASAAVNVYCLMRYLEFIQGGVPMAATEE
jgi:hypothetical protein